MSYATGTYPRYFTTAGAPKLKLAKPDVRVGDTVEFKSAGKVISRKAIYPYDDVVTLDNGAKVDLDALTKGEITHTLISRPIEKVKGREYTATQVRQAQTQWQVGTQIRGTWDDTMRVLGGDGFWYSINTGRYGDKVGKATKFTDLSGSYELIFARDAK